MRKVVYIEPGGSISGRNITGTYQTILGSCVSLVLWDDTSRFFAMCHYLLAKTSGSVVQSPMTVGRYGELILPRLLRQAQAAGADIATMQVSLFGGASNPRSAGLAERFKVANNNVLYAREFVKDEGLKLMREDVGGSLGRKIIVDASNGDCQCIWLEEAQHE